MLTIFLLGLPLAYFLGAIPTAVWISRRVYRQDIRTLGSLNAGSTNMYRVFGFKAGLATQLIDISKGAAAAAIPLLLGLQSPPDDPYRVVAQLACGLVAVVGHMFTVFAGWRGGKGVNAALGMMLVIDPWVALAAAAVFVGVLLLGRMVSLASMVAVISYPVFKLIQLVQIPTGGISATGILLGFGVMLAVLVIYAHRANLSRIRAGTESRIPLGRKPA
jgi:glycerol-3-phosphate acyltransferase PlsY